MIETLTREELHAFSYPGSATCDRCNSPLRKVVGVGIPEGFPFKGAYIRGRIYAADGNASGTLRAEAELCDVCLDDLTGWIAKGRLRVPGGARGGGMRLIPTGP